MKPDPSGSTSPNISLREYVEAKIEGEREIARVALAAARAESLASHKAMESEFAIFKETLARQIEEAARNVREKMGTLNELRKEVTTDRANFVTRDKYEAEMGARNARVDALEKWQASRAGFHDLVASLVPRIESLEKIQSSREHLIGEFTRVQQRVDELAKWKNENASIMTISEALDKRVEVIEVWRNKLLGIGIVLGLVAGLAGAALMRVLSGIFGK